MKQYSSFTAVVQRWPDEKLCTPYHYWATLQATSIVYFSCYVRVQYDQYEHSHHRFFQIEVVDWTCKSPTPLTASSSGDRRQPINLQCIHANESDVHMYCQETYASDPSYS